LDNFSRTNQESGKEMKNNQQYYKITGGLCLVALLMLTGCATDSGPVNNSVNSDSSSSKTNTPANETANVRKAVTDTTVQVDYATLNPVIVKFEKTSVRLTDADKEFLTHFVERIQKSHHVTVKGFCDRNQFSNAKDSAIKRAAQVKEELVRLGVSVPIRVMYQTDIADKHAVEIAFPE
jgi:hypothetical protein